MAKKKRKSLEQLTEIERKNILALKQQNKNTKQIARIVGTTPAVIKQYLSSEESGRHAETIFHIQRNKKMGYYLGTAAVLTTFGLMGTMAMIAYRSPSDTDPKESHNQPASHQSSNPIDRNVHFHVLESTPLADVEPSELERLCTLFDSTMRRDISDYDHIINVIPLRRDFGIQFHSSTTQIEQYISEQRTLTEQIKQYFGLPISFRYSFAGSADQINQSPLNECVINVVSSKGFQNVVRVMYQTRDGKTHSIEPTNFIPTADGETTQKFNFYLDGQTLRATESATTIIISASEQYGELRLNGPCEYLHFCARKADMRLIAKNSTLEELESGILNEGLMILNEGVVHGAIYAQAVQQNDFSSQQIEDLITALECNPRYSRVREFYQRSLHEGPKKIFWDYLNGTIDK